MNNALLYHYTNAWGAQEIIRNGKINASLGYMTGGDSAFGNRVYLTDLEPFTNTPAEIAWNNWRNDGPKFIKKTKNIIALKVPYSEVEEVEDTNAEDRNIFLYGWNNDLRLWKYQWWLMNWDSRKIVASYRYQLTSVGPSREVMPHFMTDYQIIDETINGRPVYKSTGDSNYLFMDSRGNWIVRAGDFKDEEAYALVQSSNYSLGPDPEIGWEYYDKEEDWWMDDDATIKCHGWQI